MSYILPKQQRSLLFKSTAAISLFKKEAGCQDFYIDRDAVSVVGFFTEEQISLALKKYEARWSTVSE